MWTSPGDFGDVHGMFTPQWWPQNWNQYGLLKLLVINDYGTYIDGLKISDVSTLSLHLDYSSDIHLRLAVENDSEHVGGITLYGNLSETTIRTSVSPSIMRRLSLRSRSGEISSGQLYR